MPLPFLRLRASLVALSLLAVAPAARAQVGARIEPLPADTLAALRPLADRGAAALVLDPDGGPRARITVAVPVSAPLALVRRAIVEADQWPRFIAALDAVTPLARHGRHAAYRMDVHAGILDIHADTQLHEVGERRVDFTITASDFGPAAARWDLLPESPTRTLVVLTGWSDPSAGHWLLQRAAASNPTATAGMNVAIDLVLALAVRRRAESLAGVAPATEAPTAASFDPPPMGPWEDLSRRFYTLAFRVTPAGEVTEITTVARTGASVGAVQARVADVVGWSDRLPSVHEGRRLDDGRVAFTLRSPFDQGRGEIRTLTPAPGVTMVQGDGGDFAGLGWRWEVQSRGAGDTVVRLSGVVERGLAGLLPRTAAAREPSLYAGLSGLRQLLWMRAMLAGLAPE